MEDILFLCHKYNFKTLTMKKELGMFFIDTTNEWLIYVLGGTSTFLLLVIGLSIIEREEVKK